LTTPNNQTVLHENILSPIRAYVIRDYLTNLRVDNIGSVEVFSSLTSTNDYLAQKEFAGKNEIAICIAEEQTQGRGRFGHSWWSPSGVNLYMSILWPLKQWSKQYEILGLWLLIAIAELLEQLGFVGVRLKWPNDICIGNKKLGGILIERKACQSKHNLIIGVGMNVAMSKLNNMQLDNPWVDLVSHKPDWEMTRNEFAAHMIVSLTKALARLESNNSIGLSLMWSRYDALRQRQVEFTYQNKCNIGVVHGIDELGQIIMSVNGEELHLHSSHVSEIKI